MLFSPRSNIYARAHLSTCIGGERGLHSGGLDIFDALSLNEVGFEAMRLGDLLSTKKTVGLHSIPV
jgi:hypothetical protein